MSSVLLDEHVCGNYHSHKRQSPPEKDVGGCVGLLYQFSCTANLYGLVFTVEHQRLTITQPREPEKESKITLRS